LQEGINLRAMGQRDPLTEWQREGFEMFGQMMQGIAQDLVRYVLHVQVQVSEPAKAQAAALAAQEEERKRVAAELADAPKAPVDWGGDEPSTVAGEGDAEAVGEAEPDGAEPVEAEAEAPGEAEAEGK